MPQIMIDLVILCLLNDCWQQVDGSSTLRISKFDSSGIAGTIEWSATKYKTQLYDKFVVSFDFPYCGDRCKK